MSWAAGPAARQLWRSAAAIVPAARLRLLNYPELLASAGAQMSIPARDNAHVRTIPTEVVDVLPCMYYPARQPAPGHRPQTGSSTGAVGGPERDCGRQGGL